MSETIKQLEDAAERIVQCVEFDVNGKFGQGGNGGLTSDQTLRTSNEIRIILDRLKKERDHEKSVDA